MDIDIEWVIYHLIHDDEGFEEANLEIDYYEIDVWDRLMVSLRRNSTLLKLSVERSESLLARSRNPYQLQEFFEAIESLPLLVELKLIGFAAEDLDYGFVDFVRNHETLTKFTLHVAYRRLNTNIPVALASAPRLRQVELDLPTSTPLVALCQSPALEELTIECFGGVKFQDEHLIPMAEALCTNRKLTYFDLEHSISASGLDHMAQMLEHNTDLQVLRLSFFDGMEHAESVCHRVIEALGKNECLTHFHNYQSTQVRVPPEMRQAQLEMLERNFTLGYFLLFSQDDVTRENLYFKLNLGGRWQLFLNDEAPKSSWLDMLCNHREDLDCLYYYLSINPSLCKSETASSLWTTSTNSNKDMMAAEECGKLRKRQKLEKGHSDQDQVVCQDSRVDYAENTTVDIRAEPYF
jgi:hypothetical protein